VLKVREFKIPDISREEILANRARVEFNDRLVDIYARGNFRDFRNSPIFWHCLTIVNDFAILPVCPSVADSASLVYSPDIYALMVYLTL
jgi:hypothetical protein